jgi:hypothetical protein
MDDKEFEHNVFHTIEAINEHINMLWLWYRSQGYEMPKRGEHGQRVPHGTVGDFDHELLVIERYMQDVLNETAKQLPELYKKS